MLVHRKRISLFFFGGPPINRKTTYRSLSSQMQRIPWAHRAPGTMECLPMDRLDELEAQSIFIFREAFARLKKLALLWSLGKDSNVMIWLARKAFFGPLAFPAMHLG